MHHHFQMNSIIIQTILPFILSALVVIIIMYIVFALPLLLHRFGWLDYDTIGITIGITFNIISLIIIVVYFLSIKSMNAEESTNDDGD